MRFSTRALSSAVRLVALLATGALALAAGTSSRADDRAGDPSARMRAAFLDPVPGAVGLGDYFASHAVLPTADSQALDALLASPEWQAKLQEGEAAMTRFIEESFAEVVRRAAAQGGELNYAPKLRASLDEWIRTHARPSEATMRLEDATREARATLGARHPDFDEQMKDPTFSRYVFGRREGRLLNRPVELPRPGGDARAFDIWKASEIARIRAAIARNSSIALGQALGTEDAVELYPLNPDRSADLAAGPRARLTADEFRAAAVELELNAIPSSISRSRVSPEGNSVARGDLPFLLVRTGKYRGLAAYWPPKTQGRAPSAIDPSDLFRGHTSRFATPERLQGGRTIEWLSHKEYNRQNQLLERYAEFVGQLRWAEDSREIRESLRRKLASELASELTFRKIAMRGRTGYLQGGLWWWGMSQDTAYWEKREAEARARSAPALPLVPHGNVDSPGMTLGGHDRFNIEPEALRAALPKGLLAESAAPRNTTAHLPGQKRRLFDVRGRGQPTPAFVSVLSPSDLAAARPYTIVAEEEPEIEEVFRPGRRKGMRRQQPPSVVVESDVPVPLDDHGRLAIPAPDHHRLVALELFDDDGYPLAESLKREILEVDGRAGYVVRIPGAKRAGIGDVEIRARFAPTGEAPVDGSRELPRPDRRRIRRLVPELRAAGLQRLADSLERRIDGSRSPLTLPELSKIFADASTYTYLPEQPAAGAASRGAFAGYARFLRPDGELYFQCDGSNHLFADFLRQCLGKGSDVEVRVGNGFAVVDGAVSLSTAHARTEIWSGGKLLSTLDATPTRLDPLSPREAPVVEPKKSAPAYEPTAEERRMRVTLARERLDRERAAALEAFAVLSPRNAPIDSSEPFALSHRISGAVSDLLEKRASVDELRARLERVLPGETPAYRDPAEFLDWATARTARAAELADRIATLRLGRADAGATVYLDPAARRSLHELADAVRKIGDLEGADLEAATGFPFRTRATGGASGCATLWRDLRLPRPGSR